MFFFFFVLSFSFYLFNFSNNKFLIQGQTFKLKSWIGWQLRISSLKALSRVETRAETQEVQAHAKGQTFHETNQKDKFVWMSLNLPTRSIGLLKIACVAAGPPLVFMCILKV